MIVIHAPKRINMVMQQRVTPEWRPSVRIQVTLELRFEWWGKTRRVGMGRSIFQ